MTKTNEGAGFARGAGRGRRFLLCVAGSVAAASLAFGLAGTPALAATSSSSASGDAVAATATDDSTTLAENVAAKCLPSVGTVTAVIDTQDSQGIAFGSCVVIDADGYVITNYHVIDGSSQISVSINDKDYDATIVGSDPTSDIAVLKVDPGDDTLTPMEIGSSDDLQVGEWVMTIGAPEGLDHSVSQGIVSGLDRSTTYDIDSTTKAYYPGLIQTDAMINSGSSGGALVNSDGQLVGITTINYSTSGDFAGMSASIPSDYAMRIANEIIENGTYAHPFMGVSLSDVTPYNYQYAGTNAYFGAYVAQVQSGGAADEAGLKVGDLITAVDGEDVTSADEVIIAIRGHQVGDQVTLTVERDGQEQDITVTLGSDQDEGATSGEAAGDSAAADDEGGNGKSGGLFSFFGNKGGNGGNNAGSDNGGGQNGSGNGGNNAGSGSQGGSGDQSDQNGGNGGWGYGGNNGSSWGFWSNPYTYDYGYSYSYPGQGYGFGDLGNFGGQRG